MFHKLSKSIFFHKTSLQQSGALIAHFHYSVSNSMVFHCHIISNTNTTSTIRFSHQYCYKKPTVFQNEINLYRTSIVHFIFVQFQFLFFLFAQVRSGFLHPLIRFCSPPQSFHSIFVPYSFIGSCRI